jgi:glutaminyl-peptide cyclotransferase
MRVWQNASVSRRSTKRTRTEPRLRRSPGRPSRTPLLLAGLALGGLVTGGWVFRSSTTASSAAAQPAGVVRSLRVEVLRTLPHDTTAFTQGLLWWDGVLYESTGQYGRSELRRIDPVTGRATQRVDISRAYFGEGLARVGSRLIMLTWKAQRALVHDLASFDQLSTFRYRGEGWGLCHDGARLIMSDGTDVLTFRDPESFEAAGQVRVTLRGRPLMELNELECVRGDVFANVWQEDYLVRIDPASGRVTHQIDAAGLLTRSESLGVDVLNGIAHDPGTDTFYLTGKWWPKMFEVQFVE